MSSPLPDNMISLFENGTFIDPFSLSSMTPNLVNFTSGVAVPNDVEANMFICYTKGKESLEKIVSKDVSLEMEALLQNHYSTRFPNQRSTHWPRQNLRVGKSQTWL